MSAFLKDFGLILTTSAIVVGLFGSLVPNKATGKTARMALGLYMALVLVSPFVKGNIDFALPSLEGFGEADTAAASAQTDALLSTEIERSVAASVTGLLHTRLGVLVKSVSASINIDENRGIYCDKVVIELDEKYRELENEMGALIDDAVAAPAVFRYV